MAKKRLVVSGPFIKYTGEINEDEYARTLVKTKANVMAVCKKPHFTKAQRKKMSERPQIKRYNAVTAEAHVIYQDPVLRAEWEKRHIAFQRAAKKRGEYGYPRLWDYIRHELNLVKLAEEK